MEGKENKYKKRGNKTKQEITIPFLWEERPGAPKEEWKTKPKREPLAPVPLPVKYVASVPFKWEEKPGTPLQCFVQETVTEKKSLPLPPAYFARHWNESDGDVSSYDEDWLSELEFEAHSVLSEESFCSTPLNLQANRPSPTRVSFPSAVHLQDPFLVQQNDGYMKGSSSSESSNSPSRNANLKGAPVFQHLFPLYPPKPGFLDYHGISEENNSHNQHSTERKPTILEEYKRFEVEFERSGIIRRPVTLGELIMQSRRRSYHRKVVQMNTNNLPKDFNDEKPQGCFNFGTSGVGGLKDLKLQRKNLLTLKLS